MSFAIFSLYGSLELFSSWLAYLCDLVKPAQGLQAADFKGPSPIGNLVLSLMTIEVSISIFIIEVCFMTLQGFFRIF